MYLISFSRSFHSGALAGLTIQDTLRCCSYSDARRWVDAVTAGPVNKAGDVISDCSIAPVCGSCGSVDFGNPELCAECALEASIEAAEAVL